MAALAQGETHIVNAGRLRLKESDRLAAMAAVGAFRLAVDTWRDSPEEQSLQLLALLLPGA